MSRRTGRRLASKAIEFGRVLATTLRRCVCLEVLAIIHEKQSYVKVTNHEHGSRKHHGQKA